MSDNNKEGEVLHRDIYDFIITCLDSITTSTTASKGGDCTSSATAPALLTSETTPKRSGDDCGATAANGSTSGGATDHGGDDIATFLASLNDAASLLAQQQLALKPPGLAPPDNNELLRRACFLGQDDVAMQCLTQGGGPDSIDAVGRTCLHYAVAGGHDNLVRLLLDGKAKVDARDHKQWTPLHIAVCKNMNKCTEELLRSGADPHLRLSHCTAPCKCGKTQSQAIHFASIQGNIGISKTLLKFGASVNDADASDRRPLHYAACKPNFEYLDWLFDNGAELNALDVHGRSALHAACLAGEMSNVRTLVAKGCNVELRDCWDLRPVDVAKSRGNVQLVTYLEPLSGDRMAGLSTSELDETVVRTVADGLQEKKVNQVARCVRKLGSVKCLELYLKTMEVERNGGMMCKNNSRKRTAGGVFFSLLQQDVSRDVWEYIRQESKEEQKALKLNNMRLAKMKPVEDLLARPPPQRPMHHHSLRPLQPPPPPWLHHLPPHPMPMPWMHPYFHHHPHFHFRGGGGIDQWNHHVRSRSAMRPMCDVGGPRNERRCVSSSSHSGKEAFKGPTGGWRGVARGTGGRGRGGGRGAGGGRGGRGAGGGSGRGAGGSGRDGGGSGRGGGRQEERTKAGGRRGRKEEEKSELQPDNLGGAGNREKKVEKEEEEEPFQEKRREETAERSSKLAKHPTPPPPPPPADNTSTTTSAAANMSPDKKHAKGHHHANSSSIPAEERRSGATTTGSSRGSRRGSSRRGNGIVGEGGGGRGGGGVGSSSKLERTTREGGVDCGRTEKAASHGALTGHRRTSTLESVKEEEEEPSTTKKPMVSYAAALKQGRTSSISAATTTTRTGDPVCGTNSSSGTSTTNDSCGDVKGGSLMAVSAGVVGNPKRTKQWPAAKKPQGKNS
eukprot:GHVS01075218.1.p1 GENE.GHVS01075218.1~~GHVS01075218.1.p1  ORF type:complete len:899 (+),score=258.68 GHVS01075218.1:69-2765(+)